MVSEPETATGRKSRPGLARPYSWTEGRTQPSIEIAIEAQVQATSAGMTTPLTRVSPLWTAVRLCAEPRSVAEIAAHMAVPLGVARVLVADLLGEGMVTMEDTLDEDATVDERRELIERVLSGLRRAQ